VNLDIAVVSAPSVSVAKLPLVYGINDYLLVFIIAIVIWISSEIVGGKIIPSLRRQGGKVQQRKRGLNLIAWLGWDAFLAISITFASLGVALLSSWAYFLGIAILLLGVAIRQWAVAVLGRYFSNVIGVQENQKVVQTAPYSLIRHPSYTGILLIQIGIALVLQSWVAVIAAGTTFGLAYGHRMLNEEKILIKELGNDYMQYMDHTKRIIPFLI
jgi:protein-S-isoprenylcysteine O-methyltransferase Ste14